MGRKKILHHHHTGKLRAHEHTSYASLGVLLLVVGSVLGLYTASAATPYTGPEAGSIGMSGTVPAKPPTIAATISVPTDGQHFSESPVTIAGTCPQNTLVELFKNEIFAGSTSCQEDGTYSMKIDLLVGENALIARVYDELNQAGPDSTKVTVFYDALPQQAGPLSSLDFGASQLILNTRAVFRGIFPKQELAVPIGILGGTPPYAVNVSWGDTKNDLISRGDNVEFNATHSYDKPGVYQINIQATDSDKKVAFISVVVVVNGQPEVAAASTTSGSGSSGSNTLAMVAWPLFVASSSAVVSFWLGERREKRLLRSRGLLVTP